MWSLPRRVLVAPLLALGLILMHGGIGQAMACSAMAQMASAPSMDSRTMAHGHDASTVVDHSEHHEPGNQPVTAHASGMCVGTPATTGGGDFKAGAGADATAAVFVSPPRHTISISRATGREPPAPDLVSVLCVIRR